METRRCVRIKRGRGKGEGERAVKQQTVPLLLGPRAPSPARVRNTNSFLPDAFCATSGRGRPRSHTRLTISTQTDPLPLLLAVCFSPAFPYNSQLLEARRLSSGGFAPTFFFWASDFWRAVDGVRVRWQIACRQSLNESLLTTGWNWSTPKLPGLTINLLSASLLTRPNGVTHQDCSEVSLHVGTVLDVEDFIHASYTLEVSLAGNRAGPLQVGRITSVFAGSLAKLRTRKPIHGQRNFRGRLLGIDGEDILFEDRTSGPVRVPVEVVAKANLEWMWTRSSSGAFEKSGI